MNQPFKRFPFWMRRITTSMPQSYLAFPNFAIHPDQPAEHIDCKRLVRAVCLIKMKLFRYVQCSSLLYSTRRYPRTYSCMPSIHCHDISIFSCNQQSLTHLTKMHFLFSRILLVPLVLWHRSQQKNGLLTYRACSRRQSQGFTQMHV